jgi:hypothetical protein
MPTSEAHSSKVRTWTARNEHLEIVLSNETKGGLAAFVDLKTARNFIEEEAPLFRITLSKGGQEHHFSGLDAHDYNVEMTSTSGAESITVQYYQIGSLDIDVTCRMTLEPGSVLSYWHISVRNGTDYGVRTLEYPVVLAPPVLGDTDDDDYYIYGMMGGARTRSPGRDKKARVRDYQWLPIQYPGVLTLQLHAYYDQDAGLYIATYDSAGNIKSFDLRFTDNAFDLSVQHRYNEQPGLSFDLPYPTVLGVFRDDWYEAADLYKVWAHQQPWCAKKTIERDDLPDWLLEPRPWLCIISRGDYERLRGTVWSPPAEFPIGKFWPARKVVPMMRDYARIFGTPVVTWMEGWEQHGTPAGPVDIFPPYEGEESFVQAMADLTADGNYPFMYLAGLHWTYKRAMVGYNGWDHFEKAGRQLVIEDDQGNIVKCEFVNAQKCFFNMCIGSEATKQMFIDNLMQLMDYGGVAIQIDQQLGMYTHVCYSDDHGHPPGYGPWMTEAMFDFLTRLRQAIKARNPQATFGYEAPCEIWIQHVDVNMHRPYMKGLFPIFDYIYHEYAVSYGGDALMGLCHPEVELIKHATIFSYGIQHLVGIGHPEWDYEVNPNYPTLGFLRNTCEAQRTYAREYLLYGEMLRPTKLDVPTIDVDYWKPGGVPENFDMGTAEIPLVIHSVWRLANGKIGYVLVNWTGKDEEVTLAFYRTDAETAIVSGAGRTPVDQKAIAGGVLRLTIPARSVRLVEQSA